MPELKPCKLCGCKGIIFAASKYDFGICCDYIKCDNTFDEYYSTSKEAIAAWNNRAEQCK